MRLRDISAVLLGFGSVLISCQAKAETFTFTASGIGFAFSSSATLTGSPDANIPNAFDITSGFGNVNGVPMTLVPTSTPGATTFVQYSNPSGTNYTYDDIVYTTGTTLDEDGLLFADGGDHTNFYFKNGNYMFTNDESTPNGFDINVSVTEDASSVTPEPSSFLLLGTGLLGAASVLRRRIA